MYYKKLAIGLILIFISFLSSGPTSIIQTKVQNGILSLEPSVSKERAVLISRYIVEHSTESRIDPLLVTALIYKESRFNLQVQSGKRVGPSPLYCMGLMQIAPYGAAHKLADFCDLTDIDCNIRAGVIWLEYSRLECGQTHWQWLASYRMSFCPSYRRAKSNYATRKVRDHYCQVRSNCHKFWPPDELSNQSSPDLYFSS